MSGMASYAIAICMFISLYTGINAMSGITFDGWMGDACDEWSGIRVYRYSQRCAWMKLGA